MARLHGAVDQLQLTAVAVRRKQTTSASSFSIPLPVQETLQQNLIGQLNQTVLSADDRKTAELIIGNIDDNGFLQSTPEEMALNSGIPQEDFERMLDANPEFLSAGSWRA